MLGITPLIKKKKIYVFLKLLQIYTIYFKKAKYFNYVNKYYTIWVKN